MAYYRYKTRHKISSSNLFAFILHNVDIILQYHDNKDLERLVVVLMAILDRQEKLQLLKDIRSVVSPFLTGRMFVRRTYFGQFDEL